MFHKVFLFLRTIRYLKFSQIYFRFIFKFYKPSISLESLPSARTIFTLKTFPATKQSSMVGPAEWILLNEGGRLDEIGWQDCSRSKLWRYNQHYFDDLNAIDAQKRVSWHIHIINRWIDENPPFSGHGWEPYPTSIRIINWIKWSVNNGPLTNVVEKSLALQIRWLRRRLEWHLLGNHLFVNAKALIFAGIYFDGLEAKEWLDHGMQILHGQLAQQVLPDGGQFELTPMYHALATEDLLDLINVCEGNRRRIDSDHIQRLTDWRMLAGKMLEWLVCMSHPDKKISFFNDAAFGVAPTNIELLNYAKRLDIVCREPRAGLTDLCESGYVRLQSTNAVLIADLAPIGPDYLPGHAHADTLAFELSVFGTRIFVNSGTSVYGDGPERQRQRSTLAHNTVCVNKQNSSEVWSGFRVGSRAKIVKKKVQDDGAVMQALGEHNGYARISTQLRHTRRFLLSEGSLTIEDRVSLPLQAEARYHFHPELVVGLTGEKHGFIMTNNGIKMKWSVSGVSSVELITTTWHPEFGSVIPNKCLVAYFNNKTCNFFLRWG